MSEEDIYIKDENAKNSDIKKVLDTIRSKDNIDLIDDSSAVVFILAGTKKDGSGVLTIQNVFGTAPDILQIFVAIQKTNKKQALTLFGDVIGKLKENGDNLDDMLK